MELQHLLNYCTMNLHNYNLPVMTWSKWLSAKNLEHNTAKGSVTKQTAVIFKYNITNEYHTTSLYAVTTLIIQLHIAHVLTTHEVTMHS